MLQPSEVATLDDLHQRHVATDGRDELLLRYYDTEQAFQHIGLALPPSYRHEYDVITSDAATIVDSVVERQQVQALILPGEETADHLLRSIWDGSNMDAQVARFNRDRRLYGRAFLSVATNELDVARPLVRVESPREMVATIDERHEVITAAARFYGEDARTGQSPAFATLYLPNETIWIARSDRSGRWVEAGRDRHKMGATPIFLHVNRKLTSAVRGQSLWLGRSVLTRGVRSLIDGLCRDLTNMQFAIESHGIPRIFMTGAARGDFVDADGKPIPQWEAYYNAIHTLTNPQGKVGQLTASDLKNFETAQSIYVKEMVKATGLPASYFGVTTVNPPAEGAIVGEEKRLVRTTEAENVDAGTTLGWAFGMAYWFASGRRLVGNQVRVEWHNPATPTVAQRMDAIVKAKQAGIMSREGAWDELGWSEARKAKERAYFAAETSDAELQVALALLGGPDGLAG